MDNCEHLFLQLLQNPITRRTSQTKFCEQKNQSNKIMSIEEPVRLKILSIEEPDRLKIL